MDYNEIAMKHEVKEYDVLGIGFGPANLSVAITLDEKSHTSPLNYGFLEQKPQFEWHGGMLLDGTRMQISCLKDLVTLRNPTSPYSFINYLHSKNRLNTFINIGSQNPSRIEFNDYLCWVAQQFEQAVTYGQKVINIEPIYHQNQVEKLKVISIDKQGETTTHLAKNLIIGIGGTAKIPKLFQELDTKQVIHSSKYKTWRDRNSVASTAKIAVVGAGQSAAEIFVDLSNRHQDGEIHMINRNFALHPADDSPFVNEIFNPEFTNHIYAQSNKQRKETLSHFRGTNYSVVDTEELNTIYERLYLQQVTGQGKHQYLRCHHIQEVNIQNQQISIHLNDHINQQQTWHHYDAVILATGYDYDGPNRLLHQLTPLLAERPIERNYRLPVKEHCKVNIFLQGCCESSHGISDTLLSILALRSQEIVEALLESNNPIHSGLTTMVN